MRRATRASAAILSGALALGWAAPAQAIENPDRPPIQRPSTRSAEPVDVEPEPEPEPPAEPAIELAVESAAEPEAVAPPNVPAPVGDADALPSYADAIVQPPLASDRAAPVAREWPRDGRGMLVVGSVAVAGGVGLGAGAIALATSGYEGDIWGPTLVLSVGASLAGGLLLFGGRRRQLRYGEWEAKHGEIAPRQGNGLVAGGSALLIAGAGMGMFGTIGWAMSTVGFRDPADDGTVSPVFPTLIGVGLGSLAAGTVLAIVGMKRHKRFQSWRLEPGGVAVVPTLAPMPGGGQIGVAGRF